MDCNQQRLRLARKCEFQKAKYVGWKLVFSCLMRFVWPIACFTAINRATKALYCNMELFIFDTTQNLVFSSCLELLYMKMTFFLPFFWSVKMSFCQIIPFPQLCQLWCNRMIRCESLHIIVVKSASYRK